MNNIVGDKNEVISMILGLGIVIIVVLVIFNFVVRNKGNVSVPGVSINSDQKLKSDNTMAPNSKYTVVKGDSLWKIAEKIYGNGNYWTKIAKENSIGKPSYIEVNQQLILPVITVNQNSEASKQSVTSSDTYQVHRGDSLWKISVAMFNDGYKWIDLWNLNRASIRNPDRIEVGMVIKLK